MGVNNESDSQHKDDSVENTSVVSANWTTTDCNQPKKMFAEEIASTSKEEVVVIKPEDSESITVDALALQDADSKCEDCVITSTSESSLLESQEDKQPSVFKITDSKSHRKNVHYSSESSDESDKSSDSSDCDKYFDNLRKSVPTKLPVLKTKGELLLEDLPPVADLHITVNSRELLKMGSILHWVVSKERNEFLVIVSSDGNSNPLDEDSVLFLSSDKPLGKIHDVFGNVRKPNYIVRFNKAEDIVNKGVTEGQDVYYSPENGELTRYVLVDVLKKQKGSDASWKDNNEPPDDQIDYSDDEQEKLAKQKRRAKTRGKERNWNDGEEEDAASNKMERKDAACNRKRAFKRPSRNMFQSPSPCPSRSSPCSPQSFSLVPTTDNFGSSRLIRNAISPQPFTNASSNFTPFLQSNVPSPPPFGPFLHSVPSPQQFRPFSHSNAPSPQPFGPFPQSNAPSPQPFPQRSVPSNHSFTVPTFDLASSRATCAQPSPTSFMAAPQNNVPLQQQLLLQSQQPISNFLSRPPPNYNFDQNSRIFLQQHQSFTHPRFGGLPIARPTMQNASNQLSANQMHLSPGTNVPHLGFSGNLNISQSTNIVPFNSNGYQGHSQGISCMQSNTDNSCILPKYPGVFQHNAHPTTSEVAFAIHPTAQSLPPHPALPFVPFQTPPNLLNQQGLSNPHPPILPSQTPSSPNLSFSIVHPQVLPNQTCIVPFQDNVISSQNRRLC